MDCIFCKISKKELPAEIVFEDENVVAFKDIHPKADFHVLIVPKKHIESTAHLQAEDKELMGEIILIAKKIAEEKKLPGYKVIINTGRDGGQIVDHLHVHLLSGEPADLP